MLRFDDFELDAGALRLSRDGRPLHMEPKVLELLVLLVEGRDRVLAKEEIFDAVWPGQHVTDSVLTRAVYEARRALGDDSKSPRFIRTVHGRGYQFVAEVNEPSAQAPVESRAPRARRFSPGRSRTLALALLFVLLALLALVLRRPPSGAPAGSERAALIPLVILPIGAPADDPELSMLALSISDLLAQQLSQHPGLAVRPADYTESTLQGFRSVAEFAHHSGVRYALSAEVASTTTRRRAQVSAELIEVDGTRRVERIPLGSFELPLLDSAVDTAAFVATRDAIARTLIERIGGAALPAEIEGITADAEAYRLYLQAIDRQLSNFCDGGQSLSLLDQALERDPDFALAWSAKAIAHYNQVWACGSDAEHFDRAEESARRALAIEPALIKPRTVLFDLLIETGELEAAFEELRAAEALQPEALTMRNQRVYLLRYAGFLDEAERLLRQTLSEDPLYLATASNGEAPNTFLYLGKLDDYLRHLPASDTAYHRYYRGLANHLLGRRAEARRVLEPAYRSHPADIFGRFARALVAILDGEPELAATVVRQLAQQRRDLGAVDGEITYKQAQLLAAAGAVEEALAELERAIEQGFVCTPYFRTDPMLEPLRGRPELEELLRRAEKRHRSIEARFVGAPQPR